MFRTLFFCSELYSQKKDHRYAKFFAAKSQLTGFQNASTYFGRALRDCANRDAADLRRGLDRMRADVAARSIPPDEMRGNSITLSNFGMIGGKYAAPIVVPPTVAILGAGRIHQQVLAVDGQPVVHRVLPLSLTFDHRVVTGGEAARFLAAAIADLMLRE